MHFGKAHRSTHIKEGKEKKKKKTFIPPPRLPPAAETHQGQPQITQRVLSKLSRQQSGLPPRRAHPHRPHQLSSEAARVAPLERNPTSSTFSLPSPIREGRRRTHGSHLVWSDSPLPQPPRCSPSCPREGVKNTTAQHAGGTSRSGFHRTS